MTGFIRALALKKLMLLGDFKGQIAVTFKILIEIKKFNSTQLCSVKELFSQELVYITRRFSKYVSIVTVNQN